MKRFTKISWLLMAFALLALSACGGAAAPTADTGPIFTQIASTEMALQTQVAQQAAMPTATSAPQASPTPQPTATIAPTDTPQPTDDPTSTSTPTVAPVVVYSNSGSSSSSSGSSSSSTSSSAGPVPSVSVSLTANGESTRNITVKTGEILIFRANVKNLSSQLLRVVANLSIPSGWGESQESYSDCPTTEDLGYADTCTVTWYLNPQVTGQTYLLVYVRAFYIGTDGTEQRVTNPQTITVNVVN